MNQSEAFDVAANKWTALSNMSAPLCSCSFKNINNKLHVIGGLTVGGPSADFEALTIDSLADDVKQLKI